MSPGEFDKWRKTQEREREEEMSKLRKMLEKEGLPMVALGGVSEEKGKGQGNDEDGEQSRGQEKAEDDGGGGDEKGKAKDSGGGPSWGSKMKSSLVPKRLTRAIELAKNGPPGQSKRSKSAPGPGPGWEPANQALVDATLAQSAMSAQGNAERLKAEMAGAR